MSLRRLVLLSCLVPPVLACSGFQEGFNEGFSSSFRTSFVDSCAAERTPEITEAQMKAMCECGADGLLAQYSATELMKLATDSPEVITAKAEPIMTDCALKVMLGDAGAAPAAAPAAPVGQ